MSVFDYKVAFGRNLGLVSEREQELLHKACVALPGLGGVGGAHVQALTRLGISSFKLADMDTFDVVNFNRQLGATMNTVGQNKADVLDQMIHDINPNAAVSLFKEGIREGNIDAFLSGVDVVVDGLEYFAMDARRMLYRECRKRGIPVVNAGPIGYGAALLVFMPDGMSFDAYFRIDDEMTNAEKLLAMALGLAPGLVSDVDPRYVDVENHKDPALISACMLCSAVAATEVLKLILKRGEPTAAPYGTYYDPFRAKTVALRPRPSLTHSLRGRFLRWIAFRRFPAFQKMHLRELAQRSDPVHAGAPMQQQTVSAR